MATLLVAPSGRPVNVTAEAIGNNQVRVTWVPVANVRGYQLVYTANTSADENSVNVEDPTAVEHTLRNFSAGVRYTIRVVAYANLPSEASDPVSIELRCKSCCHLHMYNSGHTQDPPCHIPQCLLYPLMSRQPWYPPPASVSPGGSHSGERLLLGLRSLTLQSTPVLALQGGGGW